MTLNGNPETVEMVTDIRDHLDRILRGMYAFCENCRTEVNLGMFIPEEEWELNECPYCGERELRRMKIGDYFDENLGVDFTINDQLEYRGARVCIAWGGPGIWIDTMTEKVELHWWGDDAETFLEKETVEAIDDHFEKEWEYLLESRGVRM